MTDEAGAASYEAVVSRHGDWWAIDVAGVGHSQVRRLVDAESTARDLVSRTLEVDKEQIEVRIVPASTT